MTIDERERLVKMAVEAAFEAKGHQLSSSEVLLLTAGVDAVLVELSIRQDGRGKQKFLWHNDKWWRRYETDEPEQEPEQETRQELLARLRECEANEDTEIAHTNADRALLDFIGDSEIAAAYEAVGKWYA